MVTWWKVPDDLSYKQHQLPVKSTAATKIFYWNLSEWGLTLWVELGEGCGRDTKNCFRAAFSVTYLV